MYINTKTIIISSTLSPLSMPLSHIAASLPQRCYVSSGGERAEAAAWPLLGNAGRSRRWRGEAEAKWHGQAAAAADPSPMDPAWVTQLRRG